MNLIIVKDQSEHLEVVCVVAKIFVLVKNTAPQQWNTTRV